MVDEVRGHFSAMLASEAAFRVLTDAMPQMVWSTLPDGYHDYYNAQWYAFTGVPEGSTDGEAWNGMFHPDDQPIAWKRWRHSLETGEPYEIEYRLRRHDGVYRWTLGRALPVYEAGRIVRWIGTCTDIHDTKRTAEQLILLNQELSHRIKNIFAVILSLIKMTGRTQRDAKGVLDGLADRVLSFARAHDFARPRRGDYSHDPAQPRMPGLLEALMAPYQSADHKRISIVSEDIKLDERGATSIALIIHELATNAVKYGALSNPEGRVSITSSRRSDEVEVVWKERGGPPIQGPPESQGFGTKVLSLSASQQLAGKIENSWDAAGLTVEIIVPAENLCRETVAR